MMTNSKTASAWTLATLLLLGACGGPGPEPLDEIPFLRCDPTSTAIEARCSELGAASGSTCVGIGAITGDDDPTLGICVEFCAPTSSSTTGGCGRPEERCVPFGEGETRDVPGGELGDDVGRDLCMPTCDDTDEACMPSFAWIEDVDWNLYPVVVPELDETIPFYLPY